VVVAEGGDSGCGWVGKGGRMLLTRGEGLAVLCLQHISLFTMGEVRTFYLLSEDQSVPKLVAEVRQPIRVIRFKNVMMIMMMVLILMLMLVMLMMTRVPSQ
jgi:hypothetical protein